MARDSARVVERTRIVSIGSRGENGVSATAEIYDSDFVLWTERAAAALLSGNLTAELRSQLAGEIEDMGKREYREARSRLKVLLTHVLKCLYQPDRAGRSWYGTISTQRTDLNVLLEQSPSLRARLALQYSDIYADARYDAASETGLPVESFPAAPVIDLELALSQRYMPHHD
jgi:hypothetical protein